MATVTTTMENDLSFQQLISREEIEVRVREIGALLDEEYRGEELSIVMVMKGAICIVADLIRSTDVRFSLEFVQCQSYKGKERGSLIVQGIEAIAVEGRHILVVDDIFDSGVTLSTVVNSLRERNPSSIRSLVLVSKRVPRKTEYTPDYVLFEIPNRFIVGYGLDYNEHHRGLPGIFAID